jgi:Xaa-Pro dipeptidase
MIQSVAQRLSEAAALAGLSAIVVISPENVAYGLGFVVPSQPLMRWRHASVVFAADGRTGAVCVDMELDTVRARRNDLEVRSWAEFTGSAMETLAELLVDLSLGLAPIGIELDYLPAAAFAELRALLPLVTFVAADALVARIRQIKSPEEVALLERLSRIADRAIGASFTAVSTGSTEMDLAAALTRSLYDQGAEQFKLMIVATGPRSELPNVGPTDRVLVEGDVCRVEVFPVINGYQAGVCRTAVVGEPPPFAQEVYDNLVECKQLVLDVIEPGAKAREVYDVFRVRFDELGLPPINFVGHGIGVDLHEEPYLAPFSDATLEVGMVLGIEPLVYRTGHGFGMQIKDMVVVEDSGCRLLSDVTDTDALLRVGG